MSAIIDIQHLGKSYDGTKAVDDLSLRLEEGEFFGFLGPNGAGKTTTIRILTGMLQPDSGEVTIDGCGLSQRSEIAKRIGVMPESRGLYSWMTAQEYLEFFAAQYGINGQRGDAVIEKLLAQVDLLRSRQAKVGTFSRGMKQRLGLARSLINTPRILFLDEPTLGLDPQGQEDIQALLRHLHEQGVTIFLSSHLLHEVSHLCSRIAIINKGELVAEGTMEDLRKQTRIKESYHVKIEGDLQTLSKSPLTRRFKDIRGDAMTAEFVFEGAADEANALLDLLRSHQMTVIAFHPETRDLTDIFLTVTGS